MPSSADGDAQLAEALDAAAAQVLAAVRALPDIAPIVLIDGRSGAGKTTLARRIAQRWPERAPVQVLALDSVYPGWDGLRAGVDAVCADVLEPVARGEDGRWRRWDWDAGRTAESHRVHAGSPLVVEGAGILTARSAPLADVAVWLESPASSRRQRALARDADAYRPHWERWAAQEDRHLAEEHPRTLATLAFHVP